MSPLPTIIAGIDFSAASPAVLRHAAHVSRQYGGKVVAVHVLDASRIRHRMASGGEVPAAEVIRAQAERRMRRLIDAEAADLVVGLEVLEGRPADELQRLVEAREASLLVIAANDLTKKRLGSVASRCVRSAPCDVMVLRDWQEGHFAKVVVCTDFSDFSKRVLERGVMVARANRAELEVVHVMYPPELDVWGEDLDVPDDASVDYAAACHAEARRKMEESLEVHAEEVAALTCRRVILESTTPSVALTCHVRDVGADLVILGTRGHSRLGGFFLGTNAERLMHDADVSVLAVRD